MNETGLCSLLHGFKCKWGCLELSWAEAEREAAASLCLAHIASRNGDNRFSCPGQGRTLTSLCHILVCLWNLKSSQGKDTASPSTPSQLLRGFVMQPGGPPANARRRVGCCPLRCHHHTQAHEEKEGEVVTQTSHWEGCSLHCQGAHRRCGCVGMGNICQGVKARNPGLSSAAFKQVLRKAPPVVPPKRVAIRSCR